MGEFLDGKPSKNITFSLSYSLHRLPLDGFGELTTKQGDTYVGDFKNGQRHGEGDIIWAGTQDSYVGEWLAGHMEGRGVLRTNFGILYDGGFHESQVSYKGVYFNFYFPSFVVWEY